MVQNSQISFRVFGDHSQKIPNFRNKTFLFTAFKGVKILLTWARPTRVTFVWQRFEVLFRYLALESKIIVFACFTETRPNTFKRMLKTVRNHLQFTSWIDFRLPINNRNILSTLTSSFSILYFAWHRAATHDNVARHTLHARKRRVGFLGGFSLDELGESDVPSSPVWRIFWPVSFPHFSTFFPWFLHGPRPDLCFLHLYEHVQHSSKNTSYLSFSYPSYFCLATFRSSF